MLTTIVFLGQTQNTDFPLSMNNIAKHYLFVNDYSLQSVRRVTTLKSLSSLLGDFFREFWRGILEGVRDYLGEVFGGF